jgi:hypothetical protein
MNQITLSERPTAANLPALLEEVDELRPSFKMIHEIFLASHIREDYGHRDDIERARAILPSAEAWLRTAQFHSTSDAIARVSASAEPTLIRAELKRLISAWPSAKADLAGFAALLAFDVRSMRPTRYGVIEVPALHLRSHWSH